MKLSDAKKILGGEYKLRSTCGNEFQMVGRNESNYFFVKLSMDDCDFCLRQLALKLTREKEK